MHEAIEGGFSAPVLEAQKVFRALMNALARPGSIQPIAAATHPPAPMSAELGALALTLADHDSAVWLDASLAANPAIADWLRFHTGAPVVASPAEAAFALVADPVAMPRLEAFAQGTDEYPDRSTTLLLAVESLDSGASQTLAGPGIEHTTRLAPHPLPADFATQWTTNRQKFPRGVDLLFVGHGQLAGLPRSSRIVEG